MSDVEVNLIEEKFTIKFPPDLKLFLQNELPVSNGFVNWRYGLDNQLTADKIISRINWPLEGILFDLKHDAFWMDSLGDKPDNHEEQAFIFKKHYAQYPKLIPIFSHRYIPAEPNESGNPVFSVYQTDIIYYRFDLASYFANEFHFTLPDTFQLLNQPAREIGFWSLFV